MDSHLIPAKSKITKLLVHKASNRIYLHAGDRMSKPEEEVKVKAQKSSRARTVSKKGPTKKANLNSSRNPQLKPSIDATEAFRSLPESVIVSETLKLADKSTLRAKRTDQLLA